MTDPFARATAVTAHRRATEATTCARKAEADVAELRALVPTDREPMFARRCALCGWPTKKGTRYCQAHQWAA